MSTQTEEMAREAGGDWDSISLTDKEFLTRFAELVAADEQKKWEEQTAVEIHEAILEEREAIIDEWNSCVCSDLEHGVKSLNEQAAKDWLKNYPEIAKFGAWLSARGIK